MTLKEIADKVEARYGIVGIFAVEYYLRLEAEEAERQRKHPKRDPSQRGEGGD